MTKGISLNASISSLPVVCRFLVGKAITEQTLNCNLPSKFDEKLPPFGSFHLSFNGLIAFVRVLIYAGAHWDL